MFGSKEVLRYLITVNEWMQVADLKYAILIVGGAAMQLQNIVSRTTNDVDVIAFADAEDANGMPILKCSIPFPEQLSAIIKKVAEDFHLPGNWMNNMVGEQWKSGLPNGFQGRIQWRVFGNLRAGLLDRQDLIPLKLYAAADHKGPESKHFQDLIALKPSRKELDAACVWAQSQDCGAEFSAIVNEVTAYARQKLETDS